MSVGKRRRQQFSWNSVWREGGCLPKLGAGVSVGKAIFPGMPSGGEGEGGCLQVGAGVSVGNPISPGIPSGGEGGVYTSRHRCARGKIPGILSGGGG